MNQYLETAIPLVDGLVRASFERVWEDVTNEQVPPYRLYIWGSVVAPRGRTPDDLDVIAAYEDARITEGQERSIQSWVASENTVTAFEEVDLLVREADKLDSIISNGRVSEVYDVSRRELRDPRQ